MIFEFLHFAGFIIGLGAVTVIDCIGFLGRNSVRWTRTAIEAHYVTKPLILLGMVLLTFSWFFLYSGSFLDNIKSALIVLMFVNGSFLSFYISPRLQRHDKKAVLPWSLQRWIVVSMLVSFVSWWTLVYITVRSLMI